ncbi:hypothetical protein PsYK624_145470, partial [Phanerochaete sordida]
MQLMQQAGLDLDENLGHENVVPTATTLAMWQEGAEGALETEIPSASTIAHDPARAIAVTVGIRVVINITGADLMHTTATALRPPCAQDDDPDRPRTVLLDDNRSQDAVDKSSRDYPDGDVEWEVPDAPEHRVHDPMWRRNKWVWRNNGHTHYKGYKNAKKTVCCGVIMCRKCNTLIRPFTQTASRKEQLTMFCTNMHCLHADLIHIPCKAHSIRYEITRDGQTFLRWVHIGKHDHPRPPGGNLSKNEYNAVVAEVKRR